MKIKDSESFREELTEMADAEYARFSSSLLPGTENVLGVRLPAMRKLAKSLAGPDWKENLGKLPDDMFEGFMIQGMVIGYAKCPYEERINAIKEFVPKIDSWSVCDSFCSGLKFVKSEQERFFDFLQDYVNSDREFDQRFACVMLLDYYIDKKRISKTLRTLKKVRTKEYYAKMAKAWAFAECYLRFPEKTLPVLEKEKDPDVRMKAVRKALESKKITPEEREEILALRTKYVL